MNRKVAAKLDRVRKALTGGMPDRVPVSDFFWTGYLKREKALRGEGFDPYRHYDLDYVVVSPNMDPKIQPFEVLYDDGVHTALRTGFGATIRRTATAPMPSFEKFLVEKPEDMAAYAFDDPLDPRRYLEGGDDQINGVGDAINRNLPPWSDRLDAYKDDFALFGSVCEGYEFIWRCIGTENALIYPIDEPELFAAFLERAAQFLYGIVEGQIRYAKGRLHGMYIWGDVAYRNGMMFSPDFWRKTYKPIVKNLIRLCHDAGLMVIYHGCGNASDLYEDFIEIGLDGYNPLECKAGLKVPELRKRLGNRLAFVGNIDVRELESGDEDRIRREVLYKLTGAAGGLYIPQSDHSVSSGVAPESYAYFVKIAREYGAYPLDMARIQRELAALDRKLGTPER